MNGLNYLGCLEWLRMGTCFRIVAWGKLVSEFLHFYMITGQIKLYY